MKRLNGWIAGIFTLILVGCGGNSTPNISPTLQPTTNPLFSDETPTAEILPPAPITSVVETLTPAPAITETVAVGAPKNIILLIGDGMGFAHIAATGMYVNGNAGTLPFETFPHQADMTTQSANNAITDSAASATAMATGTKVDNGVLSTASNGTEMLTLLEFFRDRCKATGLVSSAFLTHATPAAFGAHHPFRGDFSPVANDYWQQTRPNVLLGGGGGSLELTDAQLAGYTIVSNRADFAQLDPNSLTYLSGQFGESHLAFEYDYAHGDTDFYDQHPHLSELTTAALEVLDNDPDGFFLMIEGARIDHAAHGNAIRQTVGEVAEFSRSVEAVLAWANDRPGTLVIVTSDHETGGLVVQSNNGQGEFPTVTWASEQHTAVNVPVFARGPNADMVTGTIDNTDIFRIATANSAADTPCFVPRPSPTPLPANFGSIALVPIFDSYVSAEQPDIQFATDPLVVIDGNPESIGYMTFDLSQLTDVEISSARLRLHVSPESGSGSGNDQTITLVDRGFDPTTLTFANRPPASILVVGELSDLPDDTWVEVSLTEAVSAQRGNQMTLAFSPTNGDGLRFFSSEGVNPPQLFVDYNGVLAEATRGVEVVLNNAGTKQIATIPLTQGANDAEEVIASGVVNQYSTDLEMVFEADLGENQLVGLRFVGVPIPQSATITAATLTFVADEASDQPASLQIAVENVGNADRFTEAANDLSRRLLLEEVVMWGNMPAWEINQAYTSPDLTALLQAIVNRADWQANNSLVFVISGSGQRVAKSADGDGAMGVILQVEFE